ncbi:MAG TPA: hypothetical protein VH370_27090 [Humisphaera sp.]|nr:hypothetical protein [Humisphaera sp.]
MTRSSPATLAVAADYADAMLVARRAKNVLFLLLSIILLAQMGIFFAARYAHNLPFRPGETTSTTSTSTGLRSVLFFEWFTDVANFAGVVLPIVLAIVLVLIVTIMLVGRLVGVSHVTSAFCWSIVLALLLFPWQSLLNSRVLQAASEVYTGKTPTTHPADSAPVPDIRPPGALYTWPELIRDYDFPSDQNQWNALKWIRFVGYPFVMLVILFMVQARSSRGLRFALGEAELHIDVTPAPTGQ